MKKTGWIVILIIIGFALSFFVGRESVFFSQSYSDIGKPSIEIINLSSTDLDDTTKELYIVKMRWGLTYDHTVIALTTTHPGEEWHPNKKTDIIWEGDETFFFQTKADSIFILTSNDPSTENKLNTDFKLLFRKIDHAAYDSLKTITDNSIKEVN